MVTLTHWMIALALLPVVWAACKILVLMIPSLGAEGIHSWWLYALGIGAYIGLDRFVAQPMTLYVFGHELTHAVSGILSGAKIHSFKAKASGGEVRLSKTNTFISLSPYFVPLYTILLLCLYWLIRKKWDMVELRWMFQFLVGASLSFHVAMTLRAVHTHQPDLKGKGFFLSMILILLGNALIVGLLLVGLFGKTPTLKQYSKNLYHETTTSWRYIWETSQEAQRKIQTWTR